MSLKVYENLEQGSDEWLEARRGLITASTVGQLITPSTLRIAANDKSRALVYQLVAERITGHVEQTFTSDAMFRGIEDEPRARDLYSEKYAPVTEVGFMVRDDWGFKIGFSPDGTVGEEGLIEVKSRDPKGHLRTILDDRDHPHTRRPGFGWCVHILEVPVIARRVTFTLILVAWLAVCALREWWLGIADAHLGEQS